MHFQAVSSKRMFNDWLLIKLLRDRIKLTFESRKFGLDSISMQLDFLLTLQNSISLEHHSWTPTPSQFVNFHSAIDNIKVSLFWINDFPVIYVINFEFSRLLYPFACAPLLVPQWKVFHVEINLLRKYTLQKQNRFTACISNPRWISVPAFVFHNFTLNADNCEQKCLKSIVKLKHNK